MSPDIGLHSLRLIRSRVARLPLGQQQTWYVCAGLAANAYAAYHRDALCWQRDLDMLQRILPPRTAADPQTRELHACIALLALGHPDRVIARLSGSRKDLKS